MNITGKTFSFCLARCLQDCLCKSFQVCDSSICEMSSINKNDNESAFERRSECVYYDLDALDVSMIDSKIDWVQKTSLLDAKALISHMALTWREYLYNWYSLSSLFQILVFFVQTLAHPKYYSSYKEYYWGSI